MVATQSTVIFKLSTCLFVSPLSVQVWQGQELCPSCLLYFQHLGQDLGNSGYSVKLCGIWVHVQEIFYLPQPFLLFIVLGKEMYFPHLCHSCALFWPANHLPVLVKGRHAGHWYLPPHLVCRPALGGTQAALSSAWTWHVLSQTVTTAG